MLNDIKNKLLNAKVYAFDLETTGLDPFHDRITYLCFSDGIDRWALRVLDVNEDYKKAINIIKEQLDPVFLDTNKHVVFHNAKFDLLFLRNNNIEIENILNDTLLLSWLYDEDYSRYPHGLKECVKKELGVTMVKYEEASSLFGNMESYASADAYYTYLLYHKYLDMLKDSPEVIKVYREVETKVIKCLIDMEYRGVRLNQDILRNLRKKCIDSLDSLTEIVHLFACIKDQEKHKALTKICFDIEKAGGDHSKIIALLRSHNLVPVIFDIGSSKQCADILFTDQKLGMKGDGSNEFSELGKSGVFSTSDDVLKVMSMAGFGIATKILEYRSLNTRLNTFIIPLLDRCRLCIINQEDTIIHPEFKQTGTVSGRFSSKNPNYQNLPRKGGIRDAFVARQGYKIVKADYSQAELRLVAHYSKDQTMINIYNNNGDIHKITADACGLTGKDGRQAAKAINFGLIYRMSAPRLQGALKLDAKLEVSIEQAQEYIDKYFRTYNKVKLFHKTVETMTFRRLNESKNDISYVSLLSGRRRHLDRAYLTDKKTSYTAVTQMINSIIQGGVADLIKYSMKNIREAFIQKDWLDPKTNKWKAYLQGQVHDEVMCECEENIAEEAKNIIEVNMLNAGKDYKIIVPMVSDAAIVDSLSKG